MTENLKLFAVCLVTYLVLDFVWLGFIAKNLYLKYMAGIGRIEDGQFQIVYPAGVAVYILMSIGVIVFVLPLITETTSLVSTFLTGALLGLIMYGVYDMTNYATLKDWSLILSAADVAWGSTLSGIVAVVARFAKNYFAAA